MNTTYLIIEVIICFISLVLLYKIYSNKGLYTYIITFFILASIMSLKTVDILKYTINLGIVPFISVFIAANTLTQKKGKEEIKKLILVLLFSSLISYIVLFLVSKMDSSTVNLFTNKSFDNIFMESIRMFFSNIVTMIYMLYFNSIVYSYLKKEKNKIWISNIFSTIIIHFFASIIFILLAYAITSSVMTIIGMILIRYACSIVVGILGTIPIYINNAIKEK